MNTSDKLLRFGPQAFCRGPSALPPLTIVLAAAAVAVAACSNASATGPVTTAATTDADATALSTDATSFAPDTTPDSSAPSPCDTFHALIDSDMVAYANTNSVRHEAVFAVKTERCGTHVYVANEETPGSERGYPLGSITKTYVAAVVMGLQVKGLVDLNAPIGTYVRNIPSGDVITVKQLLGHRSGLYNYTDSSRFSQATVYTPEQLIAIAAAEPLTFNPGTAFGYSNTNYIVLGMLIEAVTSAPVQKALHDYAFTPASLSRTWFAGPEGELAPIASGWRSSTRPWPLESPTGAWTAGSMVATPTDALLWMRALVRAQVLPEATTNSMLPELNSRDAYGLGISMVPAANSLGLGTLFGHSGSIGPFGAQVFYAPESDTTFFSATTQNGLSPNDIALAVVPRVAAFIEGSALRR